MLNGGGAVLYILLVICLQGENKMRSSLFMCRRLGLFSETSVILLILLFPVLALAEKPIKPQDSSTLILYFENDIFSGTDKQYTNAVKLSWLSKDLQKTGDDQKGLPNWSRWIADKSIGLKRKNVFHNFALSLGQNIYTPQNISEKDLIDDDRPYAGWTYLAGALHSKNFDFLNTLELSLGIVGPSSLAEETQKLIHELFNTDEPLGWSNQLKDEFGFMFTWQRFWRALRNPVGKGFSYDVIPHAGITLGNVFTYANLGGEVRFGYNLPADFGTSLIRPGGGTSSPVSMSDPRLSSRSDFGLTFFAGIDGRAVARNIFLDGNTWRDSHSVDKNYFVADVSAGVSLIYRRIKLSYTHVYRTEEFEGQKGGQSFGSVSLAVTF
jgi:hypothetical protein